MTRIPVSEEAFTLIELAREECTRDDKDMQIAFLATLYCTLRRFVSRGIGRPIVEGAGPSEKEKQRAEAAKQTRTAKEIESEEGA